MIIDDMKNLRIGSLFSGYGGLDLALREVFPDSETAWVCDVEPGPCKILAQRFPGVPNLGDITTVDWETVEPVDIIAGGHQPSLADTVEHCMRQWGSSTGESMPPRLPAGRKFWGVLRLNQPGKTGKPQLSPIFVEWMMGLPEGWVTDIKISRAVQLRALGNGVVQQQAALAVTHLLGKD